MLFFTANAQVADKVLDHHINTWGRFADRRSANLFVHLDKTLYTPNEQMLFTSYLLDGGGDTSLHHILYVVLINLAEKKVAARDRFLMNGPVSSGTLYIPDTLNAGEYLFAAYTNNMKEGASKAFFRRQIMLKVKKKAAFDLTIAIKKEEKVPADSVRVSCRVSTGYGGLAIGGNFNYTLMGDGKVLQTGKRKLDAFAETTISLPAKDTLLKSVLLYAGIGRGTDSLKIRRRIILRPDLVNVTYYPESGHLIDGCPTRIGIDARQSSGMGIATDGLLLEDGQPVARFKTDAYGFGFVDCTPDRNRKYEIRLSNLSESNYIREQFPVILKDGFGLIIDNAVVKDSLTIKVHVPTENDSFRLMVYTPVSLLYSSLIKVKGTGGILTIPATRWPGGLAYISVYNNAGEPVAERSIYIPVPAITVAIKTDSSAYHQRSKVQVQLKLTDAEGNGIKGVFSLASVLASRVGAVSSTISGHSRFNRYFSAGDDLLPSAEYFNDDDAINLLLLTHLRAQDPWKSIVEESAIALKPVPATDDYGYVQYNERKVRKPVPLFLLGPSMYNLETDSFGRFQIPPGALVAPWGGGNPILTVLDKKHQEDYQIYLQNRYDTINKQLATEWYSPAYLQQDTTIRYEEESTTFNAVKTLKAVVVKSNGQEDSPVYIGNCTDRVCMNTILNCPNHPGCCSVPRNGMTYYSPERGGRQVVYRGTCNVGVPFNGVPAIHLTPELYKSDTSNLNPGVPSVLSTVYWAPLIATDNNGEATVCFYTNDLPGKFSIIIQGISNSAVFSGRGVFKVVE